MLKTSNQSLAVKYYEIGHFQKYHNTLCLPSKILHKHCFHFPLGPTMVPRENRNNVYAKFWRANKEYYGIFESSLLVYWQQNMQTKYA